MKTKTNTTPKSPKPKSPKPKSPKPKSPKKTLLYKKNRQAAVDLVNFSLSKKHTIDKGLDKYDIIKELGRGAFGKVVLGVNKNTGKKVAIKIQLNDGNGDLFEKEIDMLKKISKYCDNLICIREHGKIENNMHYIVMDYATGMSLSDYVTEYDLQIPHIIKIIEQLIEATQMLHQNGISHSDIKPDNIQIDPLTLHVKLLDLGLACDNVEYCGGGGTSIFMPDNFSRDLKGRQSTDVWAIATVLLFMIAGPSNENKVYEILESKDVRKIILRQVVENKYFDNAKISFILSEFFHKNENRRLEAIKDY